MPHHALKACAIAALSLQLLASGAQASCARLARSFADQPYGPKSNNAPLQNMDIWTNADEAAPLVVFVHGGGWRNGDKRAGKLLAPPIVSAGYAFASINYRLVPEVSADEQASDIALALARLIRSAPAYRFDPSRIVLIGHSAGAHLVALAVTDRRYFDASGVDRKRIKGVILLDGVAYDMAAHIDGYPRATRLFGTTREDWRKVSPIAQIDSTEYLPRFLILFGQQRKLTVLQATRLTDALRQAGHQATRRAFLGSTHGEFVLDWCDRGREIPQSGLSFLTDVLDTN